MNNLEIKFKLKAFLVLILVGILCSGFFTWDEEFLIAIGLVILIFFLYAFLKESIFGSLNEQIDKIAIRFMFFYTLNIIILKILIGSFSREFDLVDSLTKVFSFIDVYLNEFYKLQNRRLTILFRNSVNLILLRVLFYNLTFKEYLIFSNVELKVALERNLKYKLKVGPKRELNIGLKHELSNSSLIIKVFMTMLELLIYNKKVNLLYFPRYN